MAELMFPDIVGSYQRGYSFGSDMKDKREGEQKRSRLASLAQRAYTADPSQQRGLVGKAIGVDPAVGLALGEGLHGDEDRRNKAMVNMAKMLTATPEAIRPQLWNQMRVDVSRFIPGAERMEYGSDVAQAAQGIVRAYGGGEGAEQFTLGPGSKRFNPDGSVVAEVPFAPASAQMVAVPDGRGGTVQMMFDPKTRQLVEPQYPGQSARAPTTGGGAQVLNEAVSDAMGAPQQAGDPFAGLLSSIPGLRVTGRDRTPERNAEVDGVPNSYHLTGQAIDIGKPTPEQMRGVSQWAASNGFEVISNYKDGHVHLEPAPGAARASQGGRMGYTPPKAPTEAQESFGQPQPMTGPDGRVRMVQFGNRGGMREVQGYDAPPTARDAKPPTDGQLQAAGFFERMSAAERELEATVAAGYQPGNMRDFMTAGQGPLRNWAATDEGQKYRQQQEDWVRSKLRKESGAVIGDDEMEREIKVYFPQPGDSDAVIKQKAKSRAIAIDAMRKNAGRALSQETPSAPQAPAVGGVDDLLGKYGNPLMATLEQLEAALRAADAAGNVEDAKRLARAYSEMRGQSGDFGSVQSKAFSTEGKQRLSVDDWQAERDALGQQDRLGDMGKYRRYMAGVGFSGRDTLQGLKQTGTSALEHLTRFGPNETDASRFFAGRVDEQQAEEAQFRKETDAVRSDPYVMAGNVVGTLGQVFTPGAFLRGTKAASAFLPTSIGSNAAQGGILGLIQPTTSDGERVANASIGTGAGGVGAAAPKLAGGLSRLVGGAVGRPTLSGAERRAAETIRDESTGIAGLMNAQPSAVPGVQRTLAEESLDPGIARLERQMRGQTNIFQPIDTANNAARVRAIEGFAGDDAALRSAEKARTKGSKPLLGRAYLDKGVDVGAVRGAVDAAIKSNATRPSVASALTDVQGALEKAGDDVFSLYGVRKYIGDLLSGKAGADKSYAKAASKELKAIQETLDEKIAEQSPAFAQYLAAYRDGSKPINRMQTGQQLLAPDSGGAVLDPQTGVQVLTPASFSKKARDLDSVAAKATGFKKAKADQILTPDDLKTIRAVQDDLERQSFRATAGSGGNSMTQERMALQDKMGSRLASKLPIIGGFVEALDGLGKQRVNERLSYLLANPDEARKVLASLNKQDRATLNKALFQLSARTSSASPALAE